MTLLIAGILVLSFMASCVLRRRIQAGSVEANPWRKWVLYLCEAFRISNDTDAILGTSLDFAVGIPAFEV